MDSTYGKIMAIIFFLGQWLILNNVPAATGDLDEIIVTATRGEKELSKVPAAVSVVGQDDIQLGRQQLGLDESLVRIPGLVMQNRYNFAQDLRVSIRGAGSRASFGIRGIKIYIDDIPATTTDGQGGVDDIDLGSAQRIEVIRGPASSLYGSSSGGVINIYTEDGPETPFVEAGITAGEYDMQKFQLKAGGQYNQLNYLINASHLSLAGYRDHGLVDHSLVNTKFRYDFDEQKSLTVIFNAVDSPVADDPGAITATQVDDDPRQARDVNLTFDSGEELTQQRLGFVYKHRFDEANEITLRNFYVWRDFETFLPFVGEGVTGFERFFFGGGGQYIHSGNFAGRPLHLTLGFDADAQQDDRVRYDNINGTKGPLTLDQAEEAEAYGFYFRAELVLTDDLELTVGGRYDIVDLSIDDHFLVNADQSGKQDFDEFSPTVGLIWTAAPELNFYFNYGTAFETATFTELGDPARDLASAGLPFGGFNDVKAQTAESFEFGLRGTLWQRLDYDIAIFSMQVDDEIVNTGTIGSRGFFENADTDRKGLEASIVVDLFAGLQLSAAYTYSDFEFDRFITSPSAEGKSMPLIPEQQIFAELAYHHDSGFYLIWDLLWVDEVYARNDNAAIDFGGNVAISPDYAVSNIRMGTNFKLGQIRISPYVGINNMFDEKYNGNVRSNSFGGRYFEPAPDVNVFGGVTMRYIF